MYITLAHNVQLSVAFKKQPRHARKEKGLETLTVVRTLNMRPLHT